VLALSFPIAARAAVTVTISNSNAQGQQRSRFDVDGNALDAHDGTSVLFDGTYYLYGTSYACGYQYTRNATFCGFKVYRSPDLTHWIDEGFAVPPGNCGYCFRPHVVFNASTKKYVLWADGGGVYLVYSSDTPLGPFVRGPDPKLAVGGAVDESLFVDDDGAGYLIHNTTEVAAGLTADMVVERLTPDYMTTTGANVRLGLGDVEAFAVFKHAGVYHALMSDPSCAYCSGATGEMTSQSMMGPWTGAWFDPNGVHQSGRSEPRMRARIVNADNCGGQPLAVLPVPVADGSTRYLFVSDRWNDRAPNESLANFFIGPLSMGQDGVLAPIACSASATIDLAIGAPGAYRALPFEDQSSGFDGFRHYCDIAAGVERQQSFSPSRDGVLTAATITTFRSGEPTAPLVVEILDERGSVFYATSFDSLAVPWAPRVMTTHPNVRIAAGRTYELRLRSTTTVGCYGFEFSDDDVYAKGAESLSTSGGLFRTEEARDLKFSIALLPDEMPDGGSDGPLVDGPRGADAAATNDGSDDTSAQDTRPSPDAGGETSVREAGEFERPDASAGSEVNSPAGCACKMARRSAPSPWLAIFAVAIAEGTRGTRRRARRGRTSKRASHRM